MYTRPAPGFTLIETIIAIVILGVALGGTLLAINTAVRSSSDPLIHKQMLAVAEETMEEILLKPYTTSAIPATATRHTCGSAAAARSGFDEIIDFGNYQTSGICDIDGNAVAGLENYALTVFIERVTWQGIANTLHIVVTVAQGTEAVALDGWRTGYAQ